MRGILRSSLIVMIAAISALPVSAAPRERAQNESSLTSDVAAHTTLADNRWRGGGWRGDHDQAREGVQRGRLLPLEAVLAKVARSYPGYHIGVEGPFQQGGRWVYRIKWLTPDGRVMIIFADAETGQILGQRGG